MIHVRWSNKNTTQREMIFCYSTHFHSLLGWKDLEKKTCGRLTTDFPDVFFFCVSFHVYTIPYEHEQPHKKNITDKNFSCLFFSTLKLTKNNVIMIRNQRREKCSNLAWLMNDNGVLFIELCIRIFVFSLFVNTIILFNKSINCTTKCH